MNTNQGIQSRRLGDHVLIFGILNTCVSEWNGTEICKLNITNFRLSASTSTKVLPFVMLALLIYAHIFLPFKLQCLTTFT